MPAKKSNLKSKDNKSPAATKQKSLIKRISYKVDIFQQNHAWISFPYAVQKKYGEDESGYQAALVTYYGFLSLFPLLVVAMSIAQLINNPTIKSKIITSLNKNFPIVGNELQNNVHRTQKAGVALVISIVLTLYGSRGVANAFQRAMNHVWQVPKYKRGGIVNNLKSLLIIIILGIALILSGALSSYATASNIFIGLRIAAILVSLLVTFAGILQILKLSITEKHTYKEIYHGSLVATIGLQIVQAAGGFLVTHELKNVSSLYGTFATIFAILFWIYLQVRIILYATEIDTVRNLNLWPRSITQQVLTPADKRAFKMFAGRERYISPPKEKLRVKFED
jgi:membrane protein